MKRGMVLGVLIICLVTSLISSDVDAYFFTFAETKHDDIVTNWGLLGGVGGYIFDGQFGLTGAFDFRNFEIGTFQPQNAHASTWPDLFSNVYYLLDYGYGWYESDNLMVSAGFQELEKGLGESKDNGDGSFC